VAAVLVVASTHCSAVAQQLMVGADGAVHLEANPTNASTPVVIQQTPDVLPAQAAMPAFQMPMVAGQYPMAGAACAPCQAPVPQYVPMVAQVAQQPQPKPTTCSVFGDFLYLHPIGADVAHAQQQDGIGGAGTVPFGDIGVADFDYEPAIRAGGAWWLTECSSLVASYTFFEGDSTSSLSAPTIPGGGGAVGSLVQHPGAAILASAGPVTATGELKFQLGDGEYNAQFIGDDCFELAGSVGVRYAHLEQNFNQSGVFAGGAGGVINTATNIDFDGGGPKFGLNGQRNLGNTRFSIYGRTNVSPLVGTFRSSYTMLNNTTQVLLARANWSDDRFMTIFDYEFGLAWTGPRGHLRLGAGYMSSHWFNAVTTSEFINAVQTSNYLNVSDTISFDGPVAHVEVLW
jgi:hypothetical protein